MSDLALEFQIAANPRRRWNVEALQDGVRIRIPVRKLWLRLIFHFFWLVVWAISEAAGIQRVFGPEASPSGFDVVWLVAWTIGGLAVLGGTLWQLIGEQVLEVSQGRLHHRYTLGLITVGRTFDVAKIHDLRASRMTENDLAWFQRGRYGNDLGRGLIKLDYDERSYVIRPGLEPSETNNVVNHLNRYVSPSAAI